MPETARVLNAVAFTTHLANAPTGGLRDLEIYSIGACYAFSPALAWGLWTYTQFQPISDGSSNLDNFEIGDKYGATSAMYTQFGLHILEARRQL